MPPQANPSPDESTQIQPVFVARQPVFDAEGAIWGFELLYRHSDQIGEARFRDPDAATMTVIADGFALAQTGRLASNGRQPKVLINFPQSLLLSDTVYALPADHCVIEVLEDVEPSPEVIRALTRLKDSGYTIALDDYTGREDYAPLLELADIVKVDILDMTARQLEEVTAPLSSLGARLLAEKVEHKVQFSLARKLGYSFFQGHHFERAEIVSGRKVSAQLLPRLQLIQALSRDDYDTDKVVNLLSTDTGLTYRLMQFINSAFFAVRSPISNVRQAVTLLGARPLRQWLLAVAVADFEASPARQVSMQNGLARARFLQLLGERAGADPDTLFLLGLFSKLDVLFARPLEELLQDLPLDRAVKQAILEGTGDLGSWLALARHVEQGEWKPVVAGLRQRGIRVSDAAEIHHEADAWVRQTLAAARG